MEEKKFYNQQCQDEQINIAFRHLHENLINEIIGFCKAWNVSIDEAYLNADCLEDSIKAGSWQPCTDSSLRFDKFSQEYKDIISNEKNVSEEEFNKILINEKPFLISM